MENTGYLTINEAAAVLDVKPYEVVRLIEAGRVKTVTLVDPSSLWQAERGPERVALPGGAQINSKGAGE